MDRLPARELQRSTEWIPQPRGGRQSAAGLEDWLQASALRLGASCVVWVPPGAAATAWPRLRARGVDWRQVRRLAPGRIQAAAEWSRFSARSAVPDLRMLWIAAPIGAQGVARLGLGVAPESQPAGYESWPREALLGLVDSAYLACRLELGMRAQRQAKPVHMLGERAAGLLHDLRNQITLVSLTAGLMDLGAKGSASEAAETWKQVQSLLEEARGMCAGALAGDPGRVESVVLNHILLSDVRAATQTAKQRTGVLGSARVRCAVELELGTRPMALSRLVRNLVLNALQASEPDAPVEISAEPLSGGRVQLLVEDRGRGMHPEELRRMFEAGQSGSGGTGFGTASLGACLEDLEAEMSVSSTPGCGTRIRIILGRLSLGSDQRLVLFDPDPARRSRRCSILNQRGFEVSAHGSPEAAERALVGGKAVALVLARGASGRGLARLLAHAKSRQVPIQVLPAEAGDLEGWHALGQCSLPVQQANTGQVVP